MIVVANVQGAIVIDALWEARAVVGRVRVN
jgi:hypothetical protein